jgi:hypothetical protein
MHECNAQSLILPPFGPKRWDITTGLVLRAGRLSESNSSLDERPGSTTTLHPTATAASLGPELQSEPHRLRT